MSLRPISPTTVFIRSNYVSPAKLAELGPLAHGSIEVPPALAKALVAAGHPVAPPLPGAFLIDTGATFTCIDLAFANKLGLKPISMVPVGGMHGQQMTPQYVVRVAVEVMDAAGARRVLIEDIRATGAKDLSAMGANWGLSHNGAPSELIGLLGRDFLQLGQMLYDGVTGRVEIRIDLGVPVSKLPTIGSAASTSSALAKPVASSTPTA